jgi:hypothetical protein
MSLELLSPCAHSPISLIGLDSTGLSAQSRQIYGIAVVLYETVQQHHQHRSVFPRDCPVNNFGAQLVCLGGHHADFPIDP